jgi:aconitate hydratase
MFGMPKKGDIKYSKVLELDLSKVEPSLAGPKRPQDRIRLGQVSSQFEKLFSAPVGSGGFNKKKNRPRSTIHDEFGYGYWLR